jgi:hypothetical protein
MLKIARKWIMSSPRSVEFSKNNAGVTVLFDRLQESRSVRV